MNGYRNKSAFAAPKWRQLLVLGTILGVGATRDASADTWVPLIQAGALGMDGTRMGTSIAVDGDASGAKYIYVGAPYESYNALAEAGAVYVFAPTGPGVQYLTTLFAATPRAGAHFGASIAARNGNILVGAPDYNDVGGIGAGAGYVQFFFNNGEAPLNIISKGARSGNGGNFGRAVALDADFAVISSVNAGNGDGCVFTFHYDLPMNKWIPFPASDVACGSGGEKSGSSVAIRQTGPTTFLAVSGAPAATQGANALAGAVHIYFPNNGALLEIGTLAAQDPAPAFLDAFGTSVGIDANYVYVGATGRDNGAGRTGSVTIFKPAFIIGYDYLAEYYPLAPATIGGHCGASLNVDPLPPGGFILGCPDSDTVYFNGEGTARVYRPFEFLGQAVWLESLLTYGTQFHGADALGTSVDIHGDQAFVGAPKAHVAGQTNDGGFREFVPDKLFQNGFEG